MKNKIALLTLAASLMAPAAGIRAADSTNPIKHPVTAYDEHSVKTDATKAEVSAQEKAEAKAELEQAKTDYKKSLKEHGKNSDITIAAKKRVIAARHKYNALARKTSDARHDLHEDAKKLKQDKAEQAR